MTEIQTKFTHKRGILVGIRDLTQEERDFFYRNVSREIGDISLIGCIDWENGLEYIVNLPEYVGGYFLLCLGEEPEPLRIDFA